MAVAPGSFFTSLLTSFIIFSAVLSVYAVIARWKGGRVVFFPARVLNRRDSPECRGIFGVLGYMWYQIASVPEEHVLHFAGTDAAVYLLFQKTCFWIVFWSGAYSIPVLMPVAATDDYLAATNRGIVEQDKKLAYSWLEEIEMGNVSPQVDRLWAFAIGLWWVSIVTLYFLHRASHQAFAMRNQTLYILPALKQEHSGAEEAFLRESGKLRKLAREEYEEQYGVEDEEEGDARLLTQDEAVPFTVLVRDIPQPGEGRGGNGMVSAVKAVASSAHDLIAHTEHGGRQEVEDEVGNFFSWIYGDDYLGSYIVPPLSKVELVWNELQVTKQQLERVQATLAKKRTKRKRSQMRTGWMGLVGEKTDTEEFLLKKKEEVIEKLQHERNVAAGERGKAAFVFFRRKVTAAAASQSKHVSSATEWVVEAAPGPSDVEWGNLQITFHERLVRSLLVFGIVFVTYAFFMVPIGAISAFTTLANLEKSLKFLKPILKINAIRTLLEAFLPQLALIIFLALLPSMLRFLSQLEGWPSKAHIVQAASGKYFYFIIFNIFLGLTLSSGFLSSVTQIVNNPTNFVNLLASSLPSVATFFITYIALRVFVSRAMELLRVVPLVLFMLKQQLLVKSKSDKRAAWYPGPMNYLTAVPPDLLVITLCLCYSVMAPFILVFGGLYFAVGWAVMKYQFLNVYVTEFESHGQFWPHMHMRVVAALLTYQVTMLSYFGIKKFVGTVILLPLPLISLLYIYFTSAGVIKGFQGMPLQKAKDAEDGSTPSLARLQRVFTPQCMLPDEVEKEQQQQQRDAAEAYNEDQSRA